MGDFVCTRLKSNIIIATQSESCDNKYTRIHTRTCMALFIECRLLLSAIIPDISVKLPPNSQGLPATVGCHADIPLVTIKLVLPP